MWKVRRIQWDGPHRALGTASGCTGMKLVSQSVHPKSVQGTLFGRRGSLQIIKDLDKRASWLRVGPNPRTGVLIRG